jgi:hypothetical protein
LNDVHNPDYLACPVHTSDWCKGYVQGYTDANDGGLPSLHQSHGDTAPQVIFNDKPNHICLDGDAQYEAYWKGFTDGMHDFHHIKRTGVTWFNDSSAETDYHNGYQKGWADAKVNGTMLDE